MKPVKTFDKERISLNLAKLKKGGEMFEVVLDPDKVILYKKNRISDVREAIRSENVFYDAKKGLSASQEHMASVFGTSDTLSVIKQIVDHGDIQFTQEYRDQIRADKRKKIIDIICRNAIDPTTHLPHPRVRIENAMEQAKVRIDEIRDAEDQIQDILHKLRPVIPIKFATKEIMVHIAALHAGKARAVVERFGRLEKEEWQPDGSWLCTVEIPAGMQNDFFDSLNRLTHGEIDTKIISER